MKVWNWSVNHGVVGSSPTAGASFFLPKYPPPSLLDTFFFWLKFLESYLNRDGAYKMSNEQ